MKKLIPLLAAVMTAAACISPNSDSADSGGSTPGPDQLASGVNLLPLNAPTTYVVVNTSQATGTLVARENPGQAKSTQKEIYLRIVNGSGQLHSRTFVVPALGAGVLTEYEFDYPPNPPYLLSVECGCAFVWLKKEENHRGLALGPPEFVRQINRSVIVQYDGFTPGDVTGKTPLEDEKVFELNASVIHLGYAWAFNLKGNVSLLTPSGTELAHWELDGRQTLGGHTSNGSTPLEVGTWTLRMRGHGWFQLEVRTGHLEPSAWQILGINSPQG